VGLDAGAGSGQGGFVGVATLQAEEFVVFQALDFSLGESKLVLDGVGLSGAGDGVLLSAYAGGFLAVGLDFALQAGAEGFFAAKRSGCIGGVALGGGERSLGLGDFRRELANGLRDARAVEFDRLQLYEVFDEGMHP